MGVPDLVPTFREVSVCNSTRTIALTKITPVKVKCLFLQSESIRQRSLPHLMLLLHVFVQKPSRSALRRREIAWQMLQR